MCARWQTFSWHQPKTCLVLHNIAPIQLFLTKSSDLHYKDIQSSIRIFAVCSTFKHLYNLEQKLSQEV